MAVCDNAQRKTGKMGMCKREWGCRGSEEWHFYFYYELYLAEMIK